MHHLNSWVLAALAVVLAGCNVAGDRLTRASESINEAAYRAYVEQLASDEFEGRSPGSKGEQKTVEYLEQKMLELGLQPVAGGSFRQDVPLVEITAAQGAKLQFARGDAGMTLEFGADMVIATRRVRPESSIKDSEVVFVGYGIVAPEYGWNDYAGVDMKGKTALILVNDPGFATGDPALFRGKAMTYYGRWTYKYEEAARQGAAGAIIIHETAPAAYGWEVVQNGWTGPQFYAEPADGNAGRSAIEGWITLDRTRQLMELAGQDFDALKIAAQTRGFKPLSLEVSATAGVRNAIRRASSPNLAGMVPGKDRPDEYVIYMAHWDHLGRTLSVTSGGGTIYNGAIDNATGVAGILSIASGFRQLMPGPSRSVIFLFVTAEESGLIGSEHYAARPLVPLAKTAAVFNIDSLYPWGRARDIEVIGSGASELETLLAAAAKKQGRVVAGDASPEKGMFYRSDHFNFAKQGVPALYIKSGSVLRDRPESGKALYEEYVRTAYHKGADDYDPAWDVRGSIEDLHLLFEVGTGVANGESWPNWFEGNEFRALRDSTAKRRAPTP